MTIRQPQQKGQDICCSCLCHQEVDYLTDALAGGTSLYRKEDGRFHSVSWSEGIASLTGYSPSEYQELTLHDALDIICLQDRPRVENTFADVLSTGDPTRFACRLRSKDGRLLWVRVNAGPIVQGSETFLFAIFSSAADKKMMQRPAGEVMDAIYVIDVNSMELLYMCGDPQLWGLKDTVQLGEKCYRSLHGRDTPCENCALIQGLPDGVHESTFANIPKHIYRVKSQRIDWEGTQAYIQYVIDITEEKRLRQDWARLDRYYQTLIRNMPGGMMVMRWQGDGSIATEFISPGFASMAGMTHAEAMSLYEIDALAGVHPEDSPALKDTLRRCIKDGTESCRMVYRLRRSSGDYFWVQNNCSFIPDENSTTVYAVCSDVTAEVYRQDVKQRQYTKMLQHYRNDMQSGAILTMLSDISANQVLEIHNRIGAQISLYYNCSQDEFINKLSSFISDDNDRDQFLSQFSCKALCAAHKNGHHSIQFDCFALRPDHEPGIYVHVTMEVTSDPSSDHLTAFLSIWDITMKRALTQTQQRLISDSYDLILAMNPKHDQYWRLCPEGNRELQVQGVGSLSTVIGQLLNEDVLPRDKEKCAQMLNSTYMYEQLNKQESYSFHYFTRSGDTIRAKNALVFCIDEQLGWTCLARTDITDSLHEQQALLHMLAQTFEVLALVTCDNNSCVLHSRQSISKDQAPQVLDNSSSLAEKFFTGCEVPAEHKKRLFERLSLSKMVNHLREEPDGYSFITEVLQDGESHYKQVSITWGSATHMSVCAVRRDVTRSMREEAQRTAHLRSALTMARDANRAKQDFLSTMSHDIRTPMNAIVGMTSLAMAHRDDPAQLDECLRIIQDSSNHLRDLIGDILDMSRIESGRLVLSKEPFSQMERLYILTNRTQALAKQQRVTFRFSCNLQHDACVGDPVRMDQILDNLLGNAVKFTPAGGCVTLDITEIPVENEHVGWFCYTISDTGIGMNQETLKHLYDPFYREKSDLVNQTEGSGLGLSIVKNLVDYKGGVMDVTSSPGKGTTFVVKIPFMFASADDVKKLTAAKQTIHDIPSEKCLCNCSILLVEDHPINRIVAQRLLEDAGAMVTSAENGALGLELFRSSKPGTFDAILMDLRMPVMDGYTAARAIRACRHPQAKKIPIIAMTANAFAQDMKRCFDCGMNAHVAKPVDQRNLLQTLLQFILKKD